MCVCFKRWMLTVFAFSLLVSADVPFPQRSQLVVLSCTCDDNLEIAGKTKTSRIRLSWQTTGRSWILVGSRRVGPVVQDGQSTPFEGTSLENDRNYRPPKKDYLPEADSLN